VTLPWDEQAPPAQDREPANVVVPRGPEIDPLREPALASTMAAADKAPAIAAMAKSFFMGWLSCCTGGARREPDRAETLAVRRQRNFNDARRLLAICRRNVTVCNNAAARLAAVVRLSDIHDMTTPKPTILIVEDDPEIRRLVRDFLVHEGYDVETAADGKAMDVVLQRVRPDLIILDLMLPGEDGLAICRRLRTGDPIPILMLTAKSDEIDRVVGLEMGADDYLAKPFSSRELLARARAIMRRTQPIVPRAAQNRRYRFDAFQIDIDARGLSAGENNAVNLTSGEFELLVCFVQRPRRVLTRDQILDWTRGRSADPFDRTVDMLISRLRKKLDGASPGSNLINTVRNGGYLFTAHVSPLT
jgi:two-component system OmpR family response regulator